MQLCEEYETKLLARMATEGISADQDEEELGNRYHLLCDLRAS